MVAAVHTLATQDTEAALQHCALVVHDEPTPAHDTWLTSTHALFTQKPEQHS
jgi:hypothetical protein